MSLTQKSLATLLASSAFPILSTLCSPLALAQTASTLSPVVVTATRQESRLNEQLADVTVIERADLERLDPSATLGEALGRVAGVEFSRAGGRGASESLYVRGSNSGHVLVLIDGLRAGSATLGTTAIANIPLAQIERVEVVRGAASAIYGTDAIGGVVNVITRPQDSAPRLQFTLGGGTHGTEDANLLYTGRHEQFSYSLQGGERHSSGINATQNASSGAYNADRDGYQNQNFAAHLNYKLNQGEVGISATQSRSENHFDSSWPSAKSDWRNQSQMQTLAAHGSYRLLPAWQSTLRLGRGLDKSVSRPSSTAGQDKDSYQTTQDQISWQNDVDLPLGRLLAVAERLEQRIESTQAYSLHSRDINSFMAGWNAAWQAHRWQINLRHDENSQFGTRNTETLAYGYQLAPSWRLSGSYGTAFKAPTLNDLYYPNTAFVGVGNPALQPEVARNREIALRHDTAERRASLTWFHNNVQNLIQWEETAPGSWFYTPKNVGQARLTGLNAEVTQLLGSWTLNASGSWQSPENASTGKTLIRRAREFGTFAADRHAGDWQYGAELRLSGKRYDDAANTRKLAGYGVVNVHARYQLSRDLSLFARVDNLFDRNYEYGRSSTTQYGNLGTTVFAGLRYALY